MDKILVQNKKIRLNYEILKDYSAGMELFGFEVKSLRGKRGSLEGARVSVRGGEAYLLGANIPPYQSGNTPKGYEPERTRRLLLQKSEIAELAEEESRKGLTIVPISVYNNRKLKLRLAVVRGKKKYDRREDIKKRDTRRDMERGLRLKM